MQWQSVENNPPEDDKETEKKCLFSSKGEIYLGYLITYINYVDGVYVGGFYFCEDAKIPGDSNFFFCGPIVEDVDYYMLIDALPS